ncbi:Uncharacterised protein [Mycobacterium tuberculosis]|nr:Uncharacterised protein [Mycobacterium tuberculosis]
MHATITTDGQLLYDGHIDQWQERPPEELIPLITPQANPQPWMKNVMVALTDAAITDRNITITVTTHARDGWTLTVEHP